MSFDIGLRLDCLHRLDRCLPTCSDSSLIFKVSSVHVWKSGLSVHGLTLQNGPKFVEFYQTDGRYSSAHASTCHPGFSVPRWLTYKRSNLQPTNISHQILPTNCTKPRFHAKSKEVRFDTRPEIHVYRDGISDQQNIVKVPQDRVDSLLLTIKLFLAQMKVSAQIFLSLLGKLSAAADFVLLGRLHLLPLPMNSMDHYVPINKILDFTWNGGWTPVALHLECSFILWNPIHASHFGWGAHLEPMRLSFHGHWLEDQSQLHINMLEMMAIRLALKKANVFTTLICYDLDRQYNSGLLYQQTRRNTFSQPMRRGMENLWGGGGQKNRGFVTERRLTASKAYVTCYYTPRHMKCVGVNSFRFSICSFVHTFIRTFVRSSFRHRVKVALVGGICAPLGTMSSIWR